MPALPFAAPQGTRICRIWNSTSDHAANVKEHRTGRWKLPHTKCLVWHLSAPRSVVCARDSGPSAKAGREDVTAGFRNGPLRFDIRPRSLATGRKSARLFRSVPSRRTMPTHPPVPAPLYAAQAHPARRKATGSVRHLLASPMSPVGDHFPQARCMGLRVFSPHSAPIPPRCNALQCIRDGMGRL